MNSSSVEAGKSLRTRSTIDVVMRRTIGAKSFTGSNGSDLKSATFAACGVFVVRRIV